MRERPPKTAIHRALGWGLAIGLLVGTTACSSEAETGTSPTAAASSTPRATPSHVSPATPPVALDYAPLRGTSAPSGSFAHASIAAKIDNHPDARPQVGLERTDILFEELVEGGLTRYVGVWQSDIPELLGPVRSIRPMDPDIISPFGGIVAYSGGQERFVALMQQAPVYNAIHGQSDTAATFYRGTGAAAPHNVIVRAQQLLAEHTDLTAPARQFSYAGSPSASTAVTAGVPTPVVAYRFSDQMAGSWTWDAGRAAYLREQSRGPDLDTNGAQLQATNVVAIRVPISNGLGVPKTEIVGSGEGWVSTGGATAHVTWAKASATAPIVLTDDSGRVARLAPGNTWVELVPLEGSVTVTPAG